MGRVKEIELSSQMVSVYWLGSCHRLPTTRFSTPLRAIQINCPRSERRRDQPQVFDPHGMRDLVHGFGLLRGPNNEVKLLFVFAEP